MPRQGLGLADCSFLSSYQSVRLSARLRLQAAAAPPLRGRPDLLKPRHLDPRSTSALSVYLYQAWTSGLCSSAELFLYHRLCLRSL